MKAGGRLVRRLLLALVVAPSPTAATADAPEDVAFLGALLVGLNRCPTAEFLEGKSKGWKLTPQYGDRTSTASLKKCPGEIGEPGLCWVMARPRKAADRAAAENRHPWELAHESVDGNARGIYGRLIADLTAEGGEWEPLMVEPELIYEDPRLPDSVRAEFASVCDFECRGDPAATHLELCSKPSRYWPHGGFAWHLDGDKSQLRDARKAFGTPARGESIWIAHLDTGYSRKDSLKPERLSEKASLDFTKGDGWQPGGEDPCNPGLLNNPGHGTKTLSILAGKRATVFDGDDLVFDEPLGGAPLANVAEYRVSDSVIHLKSDRLAAGIRIAAERKMDVVSISMGGFPSWVLRDAVNTAYCNGTAIFAAAGNHKRGLCVSSPRTTVFPARFSRVVSVTGVTADDRPYARGPSFWRLVLGGFRDWGSWSMRGNYGPARVMGEAIGAYTPNVSWSRIGDQNPSRLADLNGAGTSAATPQVAAAAALWLQKHRSDRELAAAWRSWEKAEAVYRAILGTARADGLDSDYEVYIGTGVLQAEAALGFPMACDLKERGEAKIGYDWVYQMLPAPLLHQRMMRVEIAQLVYGSAELEKILGDVHPDELNEDPDTLNRFLRAIAADDRASSYLRNAVQQKLRAAP